MRSTSHSVSGALLCFLVGAWLSACGGNVNDGSEQGGSPGVGGSQSGGRAASGGSPSTGAGGSAQSGAIGAGGRSASGGTAPTMGGCCALLACPSGEKLIGNQDVCPSGMECYETLSCCSKVRCARPLVTCNAIPTCDAGDLQIMGECPPSLVCYSRTLCNTTINCLSGAGGSGGTPGGGSAGAAGAAGADCNPATEYNRDYVATNVRTCMLIDYVCPVNTRGFGNACGCGCEQPSTCPQWVDCAPSSVPTDPVDPLCGSPNTCPFTMRAQ